MAAPNRFETVSEPVPGDSPNRFGTARRTGSERFLGFAPVRVQLQDGGNHFGSGSVPVREKQAVRFRFRFSYGYGSTPWLGEKGL